METEVNILAARVTETQHPGTQGYLQILRGIRRREYATWYLRTYETGSSPRSVLGPVPRELKMGLTPDDLVPQSTRQRPGLQTQAHTQEQGQKKQGSSSSLTVHFQFFLPDSLLLTRRIFCSLRFNVYTEPPTLAPCYFARNNSQRCLGWEEKNWTKLSLKLV